MEISSIFTITKKDELKDLAIGCFDGLHLAHFALFKELTDKAGILLIDKSYKYNLSPNEDKKKILNFSIFSLDFKEIKTMQGDEFLRALKLEFKSLQKLVLGYDFRFGLNRAFSAYDVERISGIKTVVVPEFKLDGLSVHSKLIREFLKEGKIQKANKFLGRTYSVKGKIIKGQGLGSKELVATINLDCEDKYLLPKNGVYATVTKINSRLFKSVSFVGIRNTDLNFSLETHILEDFKEENFKSARVFFLDFLRENQKFQNLYELKKQILKDCEQARSILKKEKLNER